MMRVLTTGGVLAIFLIGSQFGPDGTQAARALENLPVLAAAHGKCPNPYRDDAPLPCWSEFLGNARTTSFLVRPAQWGVAYAFNCSGDRKWFHFSIAIESHYVTRTGFIRTGRMGRGVHMEPVEADMYAADQASDFPSWEYGVIDSTCRWSVRIVDGPHTVVEQYVPQIPPRG